MRKELIHPNRSGVIIVIYPGYNGDANGYNGKYKKIAKLLCRKNIGAVVRTSNKPIQGLDYRYSVKSELKRIIEKVLTDAKDICGEPIPKIYCMGVSAGASAVAAVAHEYGEIEKILLVAPSVDAGFYAVTSGLAKYPGELYITVGANDEIVGIEDVKAYSGMAWNARINTISIVPNCDHQFRGEANGRIFSKAPLWAFANDYTFPSPVGGIKLYD